MTDQQLRRLVAVVAATGLGGADAHPAGPELDPHTTAGKLADLERRYDEAVHAGSARAVEKQHAKGKLTARERIDLLLDEGSFVELDEFARHRSTNFGLENNRGSCDATVAVDRRGG